MPSIHRVHSAENVGRIAIVGIGGIFPGAPNLEDFWRNIAGAIDAGRNVPNGRWYLDPAIAFDSDGPKPDRSYSTWGCFIENFCFDPVGLNLDQQLLNELDPLFHLGLHAARAAFVDARNLNSIDLGRVGVILGNIALPTESTSAMCRDILGRTMLEQWVQSLPVPIENHNTLIHRLNRSSSARRWHPLNHFAASLPAALIARGLNLGGAAYTLDAACASSLYALKFACEELHSGRADAMLAGGMSRPDCQYTQMGFAQLKALSRRGRCAPLSAAADGLVVGEGAGIFVLKRMADAIAAGDQIYGVIAGIGLSNDRGANLLAPHSEGQLRAMRSAYSQAGWQPSDVDLIECHATGTPVGDGVEIASLHELWQGEISSPGQCVIGGVKSNVGHLLTGAGAAGLMKVLLAMKHRMLPPTANFETPAAALNHPHTPFRVLSRVEPWRPRDQLQGQSVGTRGQSDRSPIPRRATVNAFGFGGINAHVLIEEYTCDGLQKSEPMTRRPISISNPVAAGPVSLHDTASTKTQDGESFAANASPGIAIVGFAVHLGDRNSSNENVSQPSTEGNFADHFQVNDWGVRRSTWYQREFGSDTELNGGLNNPISAIHLPLGEFRIPPLEMQDMLPQQQLMLKVAADALRDAGSRRCDISSASSTTFKPPFSKGEVPAEPAFSTRSGWSQSSGGEIGLILQKKNSPTYVKSSDQSEELGNRTGVFIGIELDPNTTNFHLRWSVENDAPRWSEILGMVLSPTEMSDWIKQFKDAMGPPLTANRVMGNLGGIVASRLAREFNVGGPSFTISSDENSGLRACEIAVNALCRGELDRAIVGAVDLPCDIRSMIAAKQTGNHYGWKRTSDGAIAIVLKRLDDALRDGDQIHAILNDVSIDRCMKSIPDSNLPGSVGAATGLMTLGAAIKSLKETTLLDSSQQQPVLRNRQDCENTLLVSGFGMDGRNLAFQLSAPTIQNQSASRQRLRSSTIEPLEVGIFVIDGDSIEQISRGLNQLGERVDSFVRERAASLYDAIRDNHHSNPHGYDSKPVHQFARTWFQERPPNSGRCLAVSLVAKSLEELIGAIHLAHECIQKQTVALRKDRRVFFTDQPLGRTGRLAFVFPGSGNAFLGMGRELLAAFPEILRRQGDENNRLRDQYNPELIWNGPSTAALLENHKGMIFGQVALGTAICDLLSLFRLYPTASIGYSLGESAALFGLRAWTDRDEMLQRMENSTLFGSDLVRPFSAARKAWNVPINVEVEWISGVIDRPATAVRNAIASLSARDLNSESRNDGNAFTSVVVDQLLEDAGRIQLNDLPPRVYLLIINSPTQCVIGGDRKDVERLVGNLRATFVPFTAPSTVHCEILKQVEPAYRALHFMRTTPPAMGIDFYSSASGQSYPLTHESAADAITAQAVATVDFPRVIERAYADGVRLFVEIGPGSSCTRMIGEILGERPHLAHSATPATQNPLSAFLELLAGLVAERVPIDLSYLYGSEDDDQQVQVNAIRKTPQEVITQTGGTSFNVPTPVNGWEIRPVQSSDNHHSDSREPMKPSSIAPIDQQVFVDAPYQMTPQAVNAIYSNEQLKQPLAIENVITRFQEIIEARSNAHEAYLKTSAEIQRAAAEQISILTQQPQREIPPKSLSRSECMEFAIGRIGQVLGPLFAEIDQHPTRVRLPDEPLMLVDRILEIEGEPRSMTSGRVVTEHDIYPGAWYLDGDRIPTCIAVEAGQADLFLSGWLGIDFETKGLASYRLLDAVVTFHRALPQPGKTIHYDIRINNFFRQGQTYLFRFEFDATVDGIPLLTMREGCAGFFTEAELASGKGIVHTALDRKPRPGKRPADWIEPVELVMESYDDAQLLALRRGCLDACFGPAFVGLPLSFPMTLPGLETNTGHRSRMWLIDRVLKLDPTGGKFGLGTILGELDIQPDDWFLTCHFCDDQVMPGTLMYECCLHTLRIYLLRMGWIGETGQIVYEPIAGIRSRLKCRGQVRANTRKVWYEITLKEIGYSENDSEGSETAYCIADALMYADGKPIVEITDMSVRLTGLTRQIVDDLWKRHSVENRTAKTIATNLKHSAGTLVNYDRQSALFDTDRITAFAIGNPSEAFGDRYRIFDSERKIARLPGPPFQFLDRIVSISGCEPWVLQAGGEVVAQYDIPLDAWYFAANRQRQMPFAVLLETALQPCGWLAAYVGSALTSETDLSFRNLGGTATQHHEVTPDSGTLTTTVKMTRVSNSGGMIIQHYDFDLRCQGNPVYVGNTYFGFFSRASLANQIGIRDAKPFLPSPADSVGAISLRYVDAAPFADARFQMIDEAQLSVNGGPYGNGFVIGTTTVDAESWFFKAHFYQDPVVPGSLGLESFFQLLKLYAAYRWQLSKDTEFVTPCTIGRTTESKARHEWVYRGQVIPLDQLVTVSAVIKQVDDTSQELLAEGFLSVDGRVIYQMKNFSLGINRSQRKS